MWGASARSFLEVVARRVVERELRGPPKLTPEVLDPAPVPGVDGQHVGLGGSQHAVEPAQHRERQGHVLILAALEGVADQVRNPPDEARDLAVVHASM